MEAKDVDGVQQALRASQAGAASSLAERAVQKLHIRPEIGWVRINRSRVITQLITISSAIQSVFQLLLDKQQLSSKRLELIATDQVGAELGHRLSLLSKRARQLLTRPHPVI